MRARGVGCTIPRMPVTRLPIASDGTTHVERIRAASHGSDWGVVHEAKEWRCVLPGSGQVQWRGGDERIYVDALTAFRLAPGDTYQLLHEGERDHHVVFSAAGQVTGDESRAWLLQPRELFAIQRALAALRRGDAQDVRHAAATARAALARAFPLQAGTPIPALLRARQLVAAANDSHANAEEVAEEARCSPFHLARLFRRSLGTSLHQYRLHLRLAGALQRLASGSPNLADLAFECGFSSQSHFGDAFRRAVGCTPGEARIALR